MTREEQQGMDNNRLAAVEAKVATLVAVSESTQEALRELTGELRRTHDDRTRIVLLESKVERHEAVLTAMRTEVDSLRTLVSQGKAIHWFVQGILGAIGGFGAAVAYFKGAK